MDALRPPRVFVYVVDRDFGFAPNPFHGVCTLATCKPAIRRVGQVHDWVVGMGGGRLKATGRCVFAMKVTEKVTFNDYWTDSRYGVKRPVRNGSHKMLVGDNIYHQTGGKWFQQDSHHSLPDGSSNAHNVAKDTASDAVLISRHFYYFGSSAPVIPQPILDGMGYANRRSHRNFSLDCALPLIRFLNHTFQRNFLHGDPFDFNAAGARYSGDDDKICFVQSSAGLRQVA